MLTFLRHHSERPLLTSQPHRKSDCKDCWSNTAKIKTKQDKKEEQEIWALVGSFAIGGGLVREETTMIVKEGSGHFGPELGAERRDSDMNDAHLVTVLSITGPQGKERKKKSIYHRGLRIVQ